MRSLSSLNRSNLSRRSILFGLGATAVATAFASTPLLACRATAAAPAVDRSEALRITVNDVLLPAFEAQAQTTAKLRNAITAFAAKPEASSLDQVRVLFRESFIAVKRTEVFHFGPSEDVLLAGAIDSRPINASRLDAMLAEADVLDASFIARQSASARGLPGLEYFLFDSAVQVTERDARLIGSDAVTLRRRQLLVAISEDLALQTTALLEAWKLHAAEMITAGKGSKLFPAQKDAVDQVVTGMLYLAEYALVAKLAKPMGIDTGVSPRKDNEEAPRSDFSMLALEHNVLAIRAVYVGSNLETTLAPVSLASETRAQSAATDQSFKDALSRALLAVRAVSTPMRQVLSSGDVTVLQPVHVAVRDVKRAIATELASALGASIGFGYSDTD
jgi:predicted lipoprotein